MKHPGKTILFGLLLWLTVFLASFLIFPVRESDPLFFETLITIILSVSTVLFGRLFFKTGTLTLKRCISVGLVWAAISIAVDLPLFSYGPMKRPFAGYMTDIGLTYLVIPVILSAFAYRR